MSTGSRPPAAFIQVNQNAAEQEASPSALFYLFQEVSKLASPTHNSFLDTSSPPKWLNETPRQDHLTVKREEADACSFQPCQHSVTSVKEESCSSKITISVESHNECSSPWKVLSLINLQCERLMHHRSVEDSNRSSVSSITNLPKAHPTAKLLTAAADVTENCCVRLVEDVRGDITQSVINYKPKCCVSNMNCSVQPSGKADAVIPGLVEENAATSSQYQHGDKREVRISVNGQLVWNQECKSDSFSTELDILKAPLAQTHIPDAPQNTKLTFNSNEDATVSLSKPTLDFNANIIETTGPPCESQLPPPCPILPSSLFLSTSQCHSLPKQDNTMTGHVEYAHTPTKEESPQVSAQLKSCNVPPAISKQNVQKEEMSPPLTQLWRTKTPRKQPHPSRSVDIQDPDLQGVTFRMDTEVDDNREQCRLLITSKYSKELCKSVRKPKLRTRTSQRSLKTSSSEEESDPMLSVSKGKVCASCCTRKTPMWRDAEDGTPLCNACGIRYKKYRVRCVNCWHIPRKEGNSNSSCLKCGNFVKLASAQRKHTN
ncbi:GATA-type zinc finger protein 1 [Anabas testudineus]|nr:GATA-type zinc finger protein 1 [Anabas testudineus]